MTLFCVINDDVISLATLPSLMAMLLHVTSSLCCECPRMVLCVCLVFYLKVIQYSFGVLTCFIISRYHT